MQVGQKERERTNLGKKYVCFNCETKFYDLGRPEAICPKCGADQRENPHPDPQELFLSKYKRPVSAPPAEPVRPSRKNVINTEDGNELDEVLVVGSGDETESEDEFGGLGKGGDDSEEDELD